MSELERLVEREFPRLRRYACALTRDRERADALVQNCLMRALAKQHLWQPGTDLREWLFTILHNTEALPVERWRELISVKIWEGITSVESD